MDPRESPAESPGAKRRKRIQGSFVFDASEGGKGSGLDATAKGRVVESEPRRGCLEQSPEGPESVEAVPVASGVKDWPQLGSRRSEIDSPVECPGASKRGEEAHLFGPVPIPGGPCDTQPQTGNALEERSRLQKLGQVLGPTCSLEELDTWAVGQWRFEDAASLCAVGRPICLVREPDNPKDANAILVALVGPEATFGPKESALGVESRGGKKSALQGGRGAASDRGAAAFGRPKAGVNKTNVEKKRLVDGSGELQASDGAHSTGRLQEGGEGTRKDSLSKGGDNVSNMDVSNMGTTPTRTSPRKRKRDAFSTSSPARQKDTSPVREPKPKQPGKKGAVEEPRVIGYLPAVIAEHLAPVMDRFGTVFDGEVTVLPQCAGAAAGIRIRRPASIGPGGLAGGLEEGRTECRESGDGTVGRLKGGRAEGKNSGNGTGGRLEEGRAERRDSEDGAGKRGRRCDSDSRENLKRPTEQEHGFAGETERRAAEGGLGGPDTPRGTGRKGPVIAGICGAAPETTAPCFEQIAEGPSGADGLGEGDRQEHVAAADSRWRAACEAAARARAALVCDPSLPKYQGNFLYLVRTVLDADGHLFSDEETARLRGIGGLGGEGQRLLVRLFQRKGGGGDPIVGSRITEVIVMGNGRSFRC